MRNRITRYMHVIDSRKRVDGTHVQVHYLFDKEKGHAVKVDGLTLETSEEILTAMHSTLEEWLARTIFFLAGYRGERQD